VLRVALKGLLGHKLRFALTTAAVVLGVTFLAGSFVLTDSIQAAFDSLFDDAYAGSDVFVNPVATVEDVTAQGRGPNLPASLLDEVVAVDGVAEATGLVEDTAQVLDDDGEPVGAPGAPGIAESYHPAGPVDIVLGEPPSGAGEVAIDRTSADRLDVQPGDEVELFVMGERRRYTVSGITSFGSSGDLLGATVSTFDLATAQELFGRTDAFDSIAVTAVDGVDAEDLRDRLAAAVATDDVEVVTAEEEADSAKAQVGQVLGFLTTALLVFAGVALFVSAFIITNTFSIVVAQRSREFALLRALGASSGQVRAAVLVEAASVGLVASLLGVLLGIGTAVGIRGALGAAGLTLPSSGTVVGVRTIVVSLAVGIGITVLSSSSASRRASRTSPVEALRGDSPAVERGLRRRVAVGGIVTVAGVGILALGLFGETGETLTVVGGGAATTLLGVALLAPLFAGPVAALLGGVAARVGVAGRLAQRNAGRDRRRTAATASALMIGIALVTFVSVLTATLQGAVADTISEQFRADFVVQSENFGPGGGLSSTLLDELRTSDQLGAVSGIGSAPWRGPDQQLRNLGVVDAEALDEVLAVDWPDGAVDALVAGSALLREDAAETLGLAVGENLEVTFATGSTGTVEVGAVVPDWGESFLNGELVLDRETVATLGGSSVTFVALVDGAGDAAAAREELDAIVAGYPSVFVQDQVEFREQQEAQVDQILNLFLGLLALALVIALLGIANTLALAVLERTREIGLLRAVGLDRAQAGRMVLTEAVIVSVFGALLGVVVGTAFGWAVVTALGEEGLPGGVVVPVGRLLVYLVAAAVAGALAAVFPAWRAARLDVLRAVTTE
jgi:putative ABC transport system permease protein